MGIKAVHKNMLNTMFGIYAVVAISYVGLAVPSVLAGTVYSESFDAQSLQNSSFHGHGGCFPYSVSFSNTISRVPGSSIRMELHGDDKNVVSCKSQAENVPLDYHSTISGMKSRNEIELGDNVSRVSEMRLGDTNWYGWSVYFPSNEGTFASWWKRSDRVIIGQISGYGSGDSTVEVLLLIGGNGKLDIEVRYSTVNSSVEQVAKQSEVVALKANEWNDIAIKFKRSHIDGIVQLYVNGSKVFERFGPSAVKENEFGRFKLGLYHGYDVRKEVYVSYIDEVKVGDSYEDVQLGVSANVPPFPPVLTVE